MKIKALFSKIPIGMKVYYGLLFGWLLTTAMHIPDGYLSPVTCIIMFALVLPFWVRGVRSLRAKLNAKTAPLVALFAAFSFVIMMFNVPLPEAALMFVPTLATIIWRSMPWIWSASTVACA